MTVKDFLDTNDFTKDQLLDMIELSRVLKRCVKAGYYPELLKHKTLGMIFQAGVHPHAPVVRGRHGRPRRHGPVLRARHHPAGRSRDHRGLGPRHEPPGWTFSKRASTATRTSSSWRSTRRSP